MTDEQDAQHESQHEHAPVTEQTRNRPPFYEGTATIREWVNGGAVGTTRLIRELREWADLFEGEDS